MRAYVFTDAALTKHAGRFVWLSVNTENANNAPFLEKFPIEALPTLLIIDPDGETVALKWLGSANVGQLEKLFDDAERAVKNRGSSPAEEALARADRLNGDRKPADAVREYREALRLGGPDWPRRARTLESLVFALQGAGDQEACARLAREEAPGMARGPSFANVTAGGLSCAMSADPKAPWRADVIATLEPLGRESLSLDGLLADDRSGVYELMVELHEQQGDAAGAKQLAVQWSTFLEAEAAKAPNAEARAAFDPHRVSAALAMGDPARVIPALTASERDLPNDYNPAARLALVYQALGRYDEALAATDRALAKIDGPRKLRLYVLRADLQVRTQDRTAALRTLEEALRYAEGLPPGQRSEHTIGRIRAELAKLK
jgi:hypothetical protein